MAKITDLQIERAYELGKAHYLRKISKKQATEALLKEGMNLKSANIYGYVYGQFISGKAYTQTISSKAIEYYLQRIYEEEGSEGLELAITALFHHISYYEIVSKSKVITNKKLLAKYQALLDTEGSIYHPEEIKSDYWEGGIKVVKVNKYERNLKARRECLEHYGSICQVCNMDFESKYGEIGKGFIHVHHIKEISSIGIKYKVNGVTDLIPVCPNCHAMLHTSSPALTIEKLKEIITPN